MIIRGATDATWVLRVWPPPKRLSGAGFPRTSVGLHQRVALPLCRIDAAGAWSGFGEGWGGGEGDGEGGEGSVEWAWAPG